MADLVKNSFRTVLAFGGNGLLLLYFLASLVYLLLRERDKGVRRLLTTYPILMIILFFLPVFPYVVCNVAGETETFYRFLWLIPMSAVSAYATILFIDRVKYKWIKVALGLIAAACICVGGTPGYRAQVMIPAENIYQIPQDVVDICDYMVIPGRDVEAVVPHELVPYIRQYTAYIIMPYGYETMVDRWGFTNDLAEEMIKDISSAERLAALARQDGCQYIVLNKEHLMDGDLEEYDYENVYQSKKYIVYADKYADLSRPEITN